MAPLATFLLRLGVAIALVRVVLGAIILWKPWRAKHRGVLAAGGVALAAALTASGTLYPAWGRTWDLMLGAGTLLAAVLVAGLYRRHRRLHLPNLVESVEPAAVTPVVIPFHDPGADPVAEADAILPKVGRMPWRPRAGEHPTRTLQRHSLLGLDPLLAAYDATAAPRYLAAAETMVVDWIRRNSAWIFAPPSTFTWGDHSTALRCCRLISFWGVWSASSRRQPAISALLSRTLLAHARLLSSRDFYSARHNHGVDQDIALYQVSHCLDRHPEARMWRETAWARLWSTLDALVSDRGVMREHSPGYQLSTLTHLTDLSRLAEAHGDAGHGIRLAAMVGQMTSFMAHVIEPSGRLAPLGDTDADVSVRDHRLMSQCADEVVASCVSGGVRGTPPRRVTSYVEDGYVFVREGRTAGPTAPDAWYLALIGASHARRTHKHGDDLSVILTGLGHRILTDPGTFSYSGDAWRRFFVSRRAHNTVTADPPDTRVPDFPTGDGRTRLHDPIEDGDLVLLGGTRELVDGRHDRAILWVRGGSLIVIDRIERPCCPAKNRLAELSWHLGAGIQVRPAEPGASLVMLTATEEPIGAARLHSPRGMPWRSVRGATDPIQGWISQCRDERRPADVLIAVETGDPAIFVTELTFRSPDGRPVAFPSAIPDGGVAAAGDRVDVEVKVATMERAARIRCASGIPPALDWAARAGE